ncbi:hypothetical protein B0H10DRAFT_1937773 [Mycena sp. CBHHK59/15]|nr:hypothetical protein B0H10DRAFT_1937773 [Mycena sp. CBHHK59/15]
MYHVPLVSRRTLHAHLPADPPEAGDMTNGNEGPCIAAQRRSARVAGQARVHIAEALPNPAQLWTATSAHMHTATHGSRDRRRPARGARKTATRRYRAAGGRPGADGYRKKWSARTHAMIAADVVGSARVNNRAAIRAGQK